MSGLTFDALCAIFDKNRALHYSFLLLCKDTSLGNPYYNDDDVIRALGVSVVITKNYIKWFLKGKLHRAGDLPAAEWVDGEKMWYRHGKLHREGDKPAILRSNGTMEWRINGELHRENDLPALISISVSEWYCRGRRHRENDQPAYVTISGYKEWYFEGVHCRPGGGPISQYPMYLHSSEHYQNYYETVVADYLLQNKQFTAKV